MEQIQDGEDGFLSLSRVLCSDQWLVELNLDDCSLRINAENGPVLVEMLHRNTTLKVVKLGDNHELSNDGVSYIVEGMVLNSGVVRLELDSCSMGEDGGKALRRLLTENKTLEYLDISRNGDLGDIGIMAVSEGLKLNRRLEELKIGGCGCSLDCLKEFVLCLKENSHLRRLWVQNKEEVESVVEERLAVNAQRQQCGEVELEIDSLTVYFHSGGISC